MAHRIVWVISLLLSQWGLSVGGDVDLLPKRFSSPINISEAFEASEVHRSTGTRDLKDEGMLGESMGGEAMGGDAMGREAMGITLLSTVASPQNFSSQSRFQHRAVLPWLWIGAGAAMGVGIGAYVLRKTNDGRSPQLFYPPTTESLRDDQGDLPVGNRQGQTHRKNDQYLLTAARMQGPIVPQSVSAKSAKAIVHRSRSLKKEKMPLAHAGPCRQAKPLEKLVESLHSPDVTLRRQAIWEMGQKGAPEVIQPLVNSMVTADSQQRSLILAALSEIGTRTLVPLNQALILALQDNNGDVRKNAIREMTRLYMAMDQINQILGHAMTDDDSEVRATAQWALDQVHAMQARSGSNAVMPASRPRRLEPQVLRDGIGDIRRRENLDAHA